MHAVECKAAKLVIIIASLLLSYVVIVHHSHFLRPYIRYMHIYNIYKSIMIDIVDYYVSVNQHNNDSLSISCVQNELPSRDLSN